MSAKMQYLAYGHTLLGGLYRRLRRFFASRWGVALQAIVSALLLYWIATALDARTWAIGRESGLTGLLSTIAIFGTSQIFSGLRLSCLLYKPRPWRAAIISTFAGFFWSTFLPGTVGGDVVKLARLKAAGIEIVKATGAIVFDRLLNTIGIAIVFVLSSAALVFTDAQVNQALLVATLLLLIAMVFVSMLARHFLARDDLPDWVKSFLSPIRQLFADPLLLLVACLLTACNIGSSLLAQWMLSNLLHLEISFAALSSIICLVTLATMLPISLNGLGVQEVSFVYLLTHTGVGSDKAIAFSLLVRAIVLGTSVIAGIVTILDRVFTVRSGSEAESPSEGQPLLARDYSTSGALSKREN